MANSLADEAFTLSSKLCTLVLSAWCYHSAPSQANETTASTESVVVEDVVNAWDGRQESTTSASFTWRIDRTGFNRWSTYQTEYQPGVSSSCSPATSDIQSLIFQGHRSRREMLRWRPQDYQEYGGFSTESTGPGAATRFAFLGALKDRFSGGHPQTQAPYRCVSISDGTERLDIHDGHGDTPVAFKSDHTFRNQGEYGQIDDLLSRPILLAYRPLRWTGNDLSIDGIRIAGTDSPMQGRNCIIVEYPLKENATAKLWVDPSRDYHVVRFIQYAGVHAQYQIDIQFEQYSTNNWTPQGWTIVLLSQSRDYPGRSDLFRFVSCTVIESTVNKSLPEGLFQTSLATGTCVLDLGANSWRKVVAEGATRELDAEEIGRVRGSLQINGIERGRRSPGRWNPVIAFLIVCGLSLYWLRRHSLRPRDSRTPKSDE